MIIKYARKILTLFGLLLILSLIIRPAIVFFTLKSLVNKEYELISSLSSPDGQFEANIIRESGVVSFSPVYSLVLATKGTLSAEEVTRKWYLYPNYQSDSLKPSQLKWEDSATLVIERSANEDIHCFRPYCPLYSASTTSRKVTNIVLILRTNINDVYLNQQGSWFVEGTQHE